MEFGFDQKFRSALLFLLQLVAGFKLYSTSVITPDHLGQLAQNASQVLVCKITSQSLLAHEEFMQKAYQATVLRTIKGKTIEGRKITIPRLHFFNYEMVCSSTGDIELEENEIYLLFLDKVNNYFQPKLLSIAIYQQSARNNELYWVPIPASREILSVSESDYDPQAVYQFEPLLRQLKLYSSSLSQWNETAVRAPYNAESFEIVHRGPPPADCHYLNSGGQNFRWTTFQNNLNVNYRWAAGGDASYSGGITQTQNALSDMTSNYGGIIITQAGTHNYTPNCVGGSAASGNFISFVNSLGGYRNTLIIYNDPCNEIPNLVGCSGILGISGLYGISTHSYGGVTWYTGGYGYTIMNNDIGPCLNSTQYKLVMTHELTHTLAVDHTPVTSANMYAYCCNAISSTDIECLNYVYTPPGLALNHFTLILERQDDGLKLRIDQELFDDQWLIFQISNDGIHFSDLHQASKNTEILYKNSATKNLYFRAQIQFKNEHELLYSNIISYQSNEQNTDELSVICYNRYVEIHWPKTHQNSTAELEIFSFSGQRIYFKEFMLNQQTNTLYLSELSPGTYVVKCTWNGQTCIRRAVIFN